MQTKHKLSVFGSLITTCGFTWWLLAEEHMLIPSQKTSAAIDLVQSGSTTQAEIEATDITPTDEQKASDQITTAMSVSLQQVAYMHSQRLLYPAYSQPIIDDDSPYLSWNEFIEIPLPILDGNSSASLSVKKFRHFYPDEIAVELKTDEPMIGATLEVLSVDNQQLLATVSSDSKQWFIAPDSDWPEEIRLVAKVDFERGEDVVSADIRFYHPVASIVSVGNGYASGPDMLLPITLDVGQAGIYRVRANLYQSEGHAIASLVQRKSLSEGEQIIELKAFKSVLPNGSNDLELRNLVIERMSGFPGEKAGYGQSASERYPVGTFDTGSLSDEDYQMSEQERQQVAFLEQIL